MHKTIEERHHLPQMISQFSVGFRGSGSKNIITYIDYSPDLGTMDRV